MILLAVDITVQCAPYMITLTNDFDFHASSCFIIIKRVLSEGFQRFGSSYSPPTKHEAVIHPQQSMD